MGRVYEKLEIRRGNKIVRVNAQVDSGADQTIVPKKHIYALGINPCEAHYFEVHGVGGGTLKGVQVNLNLTAAGKTARTKTFVPLFDKNGVPLTDEDTLLGHDFMQKAKVKIDYTTHSLADAKKPKGVRYGFNDWKVKPVSKTEEKKLRVLLKCPKKKR